MKLIFFLKIFFIFQFVNSFSLENKSKTLIDEISTPNLFLFYFYKKNDYLKVFDLDSLAELDFFFNQNNEKNVFIIHGWQSGFDQSKWMTEFKDNIYDQEKNNVNVFIVDWYDLAKNYNYQTSALDTKYVAKRIANFIDYLYQNFSIKLEKVHLIGHSLGAQTAGFVGKIFKEKKLSLGKISGLDAAGPSFTVEDCKERIDKTDANFVEILHTNMALYPTSGFGTIVKSGKIDVFLNGGSRQKSCYQTNFYTDFDNFYTDLDSYNNYYIEENLVFSDVISSEENSDSDKELILGEAIIDIISCHHTRALDFFKETIKNNVCEPVAYQCDSYKNFQNGLCSDCGENNEKCHLYGYDSIIDSNNNEILERAPYFLETNSKFPLCAFHYQISVERKEISNHLPYEFEILIQGTKNEETIHLKKKLGEDFIISLITTQEYLGEILKVKITNKHEWYNEQFENECLISTIKFKFMSSMDKEKRERLSAKLCLVDCLLTYSYFERC